MWGFLTALLGALRRLATLLGGVFRAAWPEDRVLGLMIVAATLALFAYFYLYLGTEIGIPVWDLSAMLLAAALVNILVPPSLVSSGVRETPETFETMPLRLVAMGLAAMAGGLVGEIRDYAAPQDVVAHVQKGETACAYDHNGLSTYFKGLYAPNSVLRAEFGSFNLETDPRDGSGTPIVPAAQPQGCPDAIPAPDTGYALSTYILEFAGRYAVAGIVLGLLFISLRMTGAMRLRLVAWAASAGGALFYAFSLFMLQNWETGHGGEAGYYLLIAFAASVSAGAFYLSCWLGARLSGTVAVAWTPAGVSGWLKFLIAAAAIVAMLYLLSFILGGGSLKPFFEFLAWIVNALAVLLAPLKYATMWVLIFAVFGIVSLVFWRLRRTWAWLLTGVAALLLAALILWWFFCAIVQREGFVPDGIRKWAEAAGHCPCRDAPPPPPDSHDVCGNYLRSERCPQAGSPWILQTCKGGMTPMGEMCGCPDGYVRRTNACGCVKVGGGPGAETGACRVSVTFKFGKAEPYDPQPDGQTMADTIAGMIGKYSGPQCNAKKLSITGRADRIGGKAYNCKLSRARAAYIYDILSPALGPDRIITIRDASAVCQGYEDWPGVPYAYDYRGEEDAEIGEDLSDEERRSDRTVTVDVAPGEATQ